MDFWTNLVTNVNSNLEEQLDRSYEARKNLKAFSDALPRDVKLNLEKEYYKKN